MINKLYTAAPLNDPLDLFGQLLAQAPFALWIADRSGKVVMFNEAMRTLVGIEDPATILNRYNIFEDPIATAQGLVPYIKRVLTGQIIQTVVMLDLARENFGALNQSAPKVLYVRCLYFPIRDASDNYEYVVMLVENITQEYLEDIALSKTAGELERVNRDILDREQRIIALKQRAEKLRKQLKSLQHPV